MRRRGGPVPAVRVWIEIETGVVVEEEEGTEMVRGVNLGKRVVYGDAIVGG